MTTLYQLRQSTSDGRDKAIAICSTKAKAQAMLKQLIDEPECEQPLRENFELEDDYGHVENKHGWWADFFIEPILLDNWID